MTEKQLKASNFLVENGGNRRQAMLAAGYSPNTAKTPKKLTESKGWKELTSEHIPEDILLKALGEDIINKPGHRKAELELAFRISNKLNPKFNEHESQVFFVTRGNYTTNTTLREGLNEA